MTSGLVSVLMTAYNREKYIAEAIESVLSQSYLSWELIIVDDGSTDDTTSIVKGYAKNDNRIKFHVNEINLGDYHNRNRAASYANGEFLKYLDADDIMYSWCLDAMVNCMQKFPEAAYGLIAPSHINLQKLYPIIYTPSDAYCTYFFTDPILIIGPTGSIIRTDYFRSVKGFSGLPYIGDTELWLKLSAKWPMLVMPPDLIWWREHDEQQSVYESKNDKVDKMRYDMIINTLLSDECPLTKEWANVAIRNQKNIRIRNLLSKNFMRLNIGDMVKKFSEFNFSFIDLIKALKKNRKLDLIKHFNKN